MLFAVGSPENSAIHLHTDLHTVGLITCFHSCFQLEQRNHNPKAGGSIPSSATKFTGEPKTRLQGQGSRISPLKRTYLGQFARSLLTQSGRAPAGWNARV